MPISAPKIPDGLPELMRGLAKSVIKENPENLYVHAAEYFENLIRERDGHLDHGYPTFNAYQVYADYKEKTREKLGLTKDPSLSDGNGGDGDESGSGGSESKMRGRKRRRARKPTTRERDNPTTMVGNPSVSDEGEPQKLKSLSEESAPAPVVEQEIVKVHYNPPEATPSPGRVVSAQSVEAEHAVSSILDDEQILDSDGTTGGKETGDELVDNGDDIGTAPSTAEVAERPRVPTVDNLEPSGEMPLQDMETCFVQANVDDLLEKHSEDYKTEQGNELGGVPEETKVSSVTTGEGEDIPEGPQVEVQPKSVGDEGTSQDAHEVPKDDDENTEIQMVGQEEQQVDSEARPAAVEGAELDSETKPIPVEGTEVQAAADFDGSEENNDKEDKIDNESGKQDETLVTNEIKPEENDEIVKESASSPVAMDKDDDQTKANDGEDTVDVLVDETADNLTKKDEQAKLSENQTSSEAISTLPNNEQKPNTPTTPDSIEKSEEHSSAQTTEDGLKIAPRMGFEDDEPLETADTPSKTLDLVGIDVENAIENVDSPDKISTTNTELKTIETTANEDVLEAESSKDDEEIETAVKDAEPAEQDQSIVSEIPVKDEQDTPLNLNLSELTMEKNDLEVQPESKTSFDDDAKQGSDEQQEAEVDAKGETENKPEESNAAQSVNNDANQETKQENETHAVEAKDDALSNAEMIVTDSIEEKGNQLSDPATDPVIDQEVTDDQQATESSIDKSDIAKPEIEEKNESANTQENEHEVNKEHNVTDANDLLTKDRSLEDVVCDDATASGTVIPEATSSEGIVEDKVAEQAEPLDDGMNNAPAKVTEGVVSEEPKDCPVTDTEECGVNKDEKQEQESEQMKVDDEDKSNEKPAEVEAPTAVPTKDVTPTLESVVVEEMQKLLSNENDLQQTESTIVQDKVSGSSSKEVEENVRDASEADLNDAVILAADVPVETQSSDNVGEVGSGNDSDAVTAIKESSGDHESVADSKNALDQTPLASQQTNEETPKREVSLEEVVEEPCVKREITPSKTGPLEKEDSTEKQVEEREEIKKVDLSQLSKDSAEALFYSLKKSELENQDPADGGTMGDDHTTTATNAEIEPQKTEEDDDQDVVVKEEPVATSSEDRTKRTFTDDFLDETPITEAATPTTTLPCDGATKALDPLPMEQERTSLETDEQKDEFNPMVMVSMRSKQFQEQLHSRDAGEQLGEGQADDATPKRPIMRRCMTEMSGLQRYDPAVDEDPADSRPSTEDPSYVEEEDQFDGYYVGHIKNKILASSVSVADSDCPDGTRSSVESVDENQVRTALETIASTDTESTIASQATIQQAGRRSYLRKHSQNTSSNIPYASFGNAAIDQSLDEFIEREEQHKQDEAMAEAATKIQRSYRTHKKKLLRDYHSTMRTCTEDQSAESGEEYAASVIQIKLDQRRPDGPDPAEGDAGEESDSATASHQQPLGATGRRPMYSLNIDEYDTVARRMTLTRGVAMQRNSTPEDDSGKSSNVSTDRKPSLTSSVATAKKDSAPASESGASESRSSSDEKPPKADATQGSSDEPEPKDGALNSSRSKPKSGPAGTVTGREQHPVSAPRTATSLRTSFAPLDVQSLLLIARQRTMPVQIDSSVIRVLPKHMRKRISSAGMLDGNGKRK
ncbi:uncharacterized protein LOC4576986 [Anopheles gambiae]|uniref:uncharacterized protein LOC4576986 n=1 Tax=Anopheles gambiae TaxID=7165 RepID=UPI002AC963C2|nr:uncharacterized protein LOC4576986 [Anopheles gambiae]